MGIDEFPLAWRWTESSHSVLPADVIASMTPLNGDEVARLHQQGTKLFLAVTSSVRYLARETEATRSWLKTLPFEGDRRILLAWSNVLGLSLPWHSFITYWSDFCYPSSDDIFIFPDVGSGALAWNHDEVFEFVGNAV
jgi:hypothetical protein